jgi:anti-anti-sigma factor
MTLIKHIEILDGRAVSVDIQGPMDRKGAEEFEEKIDSLLSAGNRNFAVNAGGVEYISSEGLGVIIKKNSIISDAGGTLTLFGLSREALVLFRVFGLDRELNLAGSRIAAMEIIDRLIESDTGSAAGAGKLNTGPASEQIPRINDSAGFEQFISECEKCGTLLRISDAGEFKCPDCSAVFTVGNDGNVEF